LIIPRIDSTAQQTNKDSCVETDIDVFICITDTQYDTCQKRKILYYLNFQHQIKLIKCHNNLNL